MGKIVIRIHNNDDSDYVDYEGESIEEIRNKAAERITYPTWDNGWSEVIKGKEFIEENK